MHNDLIILFLAGLVAVGIHIGIWAFAKFIDWMKADRTPPESSKATFQFSDGKTTVTIIGSTQGVNLMVNGKSVKVKSDDT